jgi:hypothetical protein
LLISGSLVYSVPSISITPFLTASLHIKAWTRRWRNWSRCYSSAGAGWTHCCSCRGGGAVSLVL